MFKNRLKRKLKKMKLGKYLKDLSIIIIGVFITLWLTNLISENKSQKDVDMIVNIIKMEMEDNLTRLNSAQQKWDTEKRIYSLIIKHDFNVLNIAIDTLKKHKNIIRDKHSFYVGHDSYEVLKSSLLMQYIKNKDFLRKLSITYGACDLIGDKLNRYSNQKNDGINSVIHNPVDNTTVNKFLNGSLLDFFTIPINNDIFRMHIYSGSTLILENEFDDCRNNIISIIDIINKEEYR